MNSDREALHRSNAGVVFISVPGEAALKGFQLGPGVEPENDDGVSSLSGIGLLMADRWGLESNVAESTSNCLSMHLCTTRKKRGSSAKL